jgi:NAD(P) transhydrogenase
MQNSFDLIVIGSGPGGSRAAIQAAKLGKSVAIIERHKAGGGCAHFGTIPSKGLKEASFHQDFSAAMKRTRKIVQEEEKVILSQLKRNKIVWFHGEASFLSKSQIQVGKKILNAKNYVIATGTSPIRHEEFPFHLKGVHDSDSLLSQKTLPKKLLILGAGVIGCEYASIFQNLGSKVTLADRRKELLRSVDEDIIQSLQEEFKKCGVNLILGCELTDVTKSRNGKIQVRLNKKIKEYDAMLICMGRQANSKELQLHNAEVSTDNRGFIQVNPKNFQTSQPNIFAVGDIIGPPGLAAAAAEQGRIAACRAFEEPCQDFPLAFPFGIYTIPEISSVGSLEEQLKKEQIPYVVGRATFKELARGLIVGDTSGFIKILVHKKDRKILGIHAIGSSASELIHIGQAVFSLGATVDYLIDNVFNYPTFAEAYKVAALHALNQIKGQ